MSPLFLVMLGGAIGAGFRYHVGLGALRQFGPGFPWGTMLVNILGGLLMGVLVAGLARMPGQGEPLRLLLGVGVLGGFTTFSAFSLETVDLITRGEPVLAAAYVVASVAGSVLALVAGAALVRLAA